MNQSDYKKAIAAGIIAQVIWGVAGPLVKIVLGNIPPFSYLFLRSLFTCLILFLILEYRLLKRKYLTSLPDQETTPHAPMGWEDKKDIFLAGFFGVVLNIGFYYVGQNLTTVIDAWIITSTGALFVIAISYLYLHERLTKTVYLGSFIAFVGTLVIVGTPIFQVGNGSFLGNLFMLGSTASIAISYIIMKKLVNRYSPLLLTYYWFLISLIFSFPLFLWEYLQNPGWIANLPLSAFLILAYTVIGSSILSYSLDNFALTHLSASITATIGYISVVVAVALGIVLLGEKLTPFFVVGTALTFFGLFLVETRHSSHPLHKRTS